MIGSYITQYRTEKKTYIFKAKENTVVIKQYDLEAKLIRKETFPVNALETLALKEHIAKKSIKPLLQGLFKKGYVPSLDTSPGLTLSKKEASFRSLMDETDRIIKILEAKNRLAAAEETSLTCPITMEIMQNPVMDNHGHTFEKEAIEKCLTSESSCPISREPITSLVPNLGLKSLIEELLQKPSVPTFALFKGKENEKLASSLLANGKLMEEAGEYEDALTVYTQALGYSKRSETYAPLPLLFTKMDKPLSATLAYL